MRCPTEPGSPIKAEVAPSSEPASLTVNPPLSGEAPPLIGLDGWLQSDVTSLDELRGKTVVVHL